jgi:hypothetical protein
MSVLSTMKHADGCQVVHENGIAVWMCIGTCPAMAEFIASGQVDDQPWDQLDHAQRETVLDAVTGSMEHALAMRDVNDPSKERP